MFKQLHINIILADALILIPKYQKMLKALLSNKEKLLELTNTPLNENCLAVILKKLPEKLRDPRKFLISCGFSELKCKALAGLGASINLMPLSVWKKLGLLEHISTRMTLELANRAICTPAGIARDVFVPVRKPFLRTTRELINVHGKEMIIRNGDKRLTLNMRHDTSSYSNQPHKESINKINIYNDSYEDYLEDLFVTNHLSGNPTFSSHTDLTSPKVINPLSGNTTSSPLNHLLEEFTDELALITFLLGNDDLPFDIESDLREIEYFHNHDPTNDMDFILEDSVNYCSLVDPNNDLVDTIPEMLTDEHTLDYSSPPLYDDVDDDLVKLESDNDDVYDDPFNSKEDKIKESKLLIDELNPFRSSDFLPSPECDSVLYKDFFEVDALPSTITRTKDESPFTCDSTPNIVDDSSNVFNPPPQPSKDEHLDTIPSTESDEFIKSSVENLVPNPSKSKGEHECDVPACDDFTTFSNLLFDADNDFSSNSSIIFSSLKIDYLLDEFAGKIIFLKSIPPGIDETDYDPKEEIRLVERLLYDNSSPRPPKEFNFENSDAIIESFSPSPIPVYDSDPFIEEIDLFLAFDGSIPGGIDNDYSDSKGDNLFLERLLQDDPILLPDTFNFSNVV
nr:reverse transcriptase domain-containing protein [Tanacetum cinerariifolium]